MKGLIALKDKKLVEIPESLALMTYGEKVKFFHSEWFLTLSNVT